MVVFCCCYLCIVIISVVTVIEIGTETAVFRQNRTETEILSLSVGGFENGAALVSTVL